MLMQNPPLSAEEIIKRAAPTQAPGIPVEYVLQSIQQEAQQPNTIVKQFGNTLFIANLGEQGMAFFRALNADTPQNYIHSTVQFFELMRQNGFPVLITQFKDPSIINIAKGVEAIYDRQAAMGFQVQRTADGGFQMVIQLEELGQ